MNYDLTQIHFTKWWIKHNAREIINNPLLRPTQEDYEKYITDPKVLKEFGFPENFLEK